VRLRWLTPGNAAYVAVPAAQLLPSAAAGGSGLLGSYFNNTTLAGTSVLARTEAVDFNWGSGSPGAGVTADNFSVRWSGTVAAAAAGSYRFQTESDDGVRLWVNGTLLIDRWTDHGPTTDTSAVVSLAAGQRVTVRMEYYERGGGAVARLRWLVPGGSSYAAVPAANLYAN
jgi:PA14 domain